MAERCPYETNNNINMYPNLSSDMSDDQQLV